MPVNALLDRPPQPPSAQAAGPPAIRLRVHSPSTDGALEAGINRHFVGFDAGFSQFREAYPTLQHRLVRSAGPAAVHDAPMHDWTQREHLAIYQEVFRPHRVDRQMALSVPLPVGEAMLLAGFPRDDAPAFDGTRHQLLKLLVPAFEASLRFRRHLATADVRLAAVLDRLEVALLVLDADGRERYRNRALRRLLPDAEAEAIVRAASDLARGLRPAAAVEGLPAVQRPLDLASGRYVLRASPNALLLDDAGVLVSVERASVLPAPQRLQQAHGLTPREAEVALHLARGRSDQEIAEALVISVHTVRRHTAQVLKKLDLPSRAGVALALVQTR
jgi:DNA-binding CsgD family transcriptional regulator